MSTTRLLRRARDRAAAWAAPRRTWTLGAASVALDDGERLRYDRLLLATGAEPAPARDPRRDARRRALPAHRRRLRRAASAAGPRRLGSSWSAPAGSAPRSRRRPGSAAWTSRVIDPHAVPLERVLGREVGAIYRDIHADHGVRMLLGTGVEAFEGDGAVERVRTSDGATIDCDFVVVGIGVRAARRSSRPRRGLAVDDGILVDERLQTSAPACSPPATSPDAHHPFYGAADPRRALGERARTRARSRPATCSAATTRSTACRTSSPTSTTSAWSTPATRRPGTGSSSAAIRRAASSSPSGSRGEPRARGHERQRLGRHRRRSSG